MPAGWAFQDSDIVVPPPYRPRSPVRWVVMTAEQLISFARGAPSLDIVDIEGLKAAAVRALRRRPGRRHRLRHVRRLPAPAEVDRRQARRRDRPGAGDQRFAAGRRVPLRAPGQARRRGGGGAADLRPDPAQPAAAGERGALGDHPARTASTPTSWASCWSRGCARSWRTSSRTIRTRPGSRCRWRSGAPCSPWRPSTASRSSRTTRTPTSGSGASSCPRCSPWTSTVWWCTRPASPRRSAPGSGSVTWSGRLR